MVPLAVELPAPAAGADEVRRAVAEVLSRPEFEDLDPSLGERIRGWIVEQLGRLLDAVAGTGRAGLIGSVVLVAAVAVAVALAVGFARGIRRDPAHHVAVGDRVGRDPAAWAADADEHEAAGRHREALRCRYRSLIAELAATGVVDEAPGRTSGEYLGQVVQRRPDLADDVAAVTRAFEASWYGNAAVGEATRVDVRRRAAAVAAGSRVGAGAGAGAARAGAGPA